MGTNDVILYALRIAADEARRAAADLSNVTAALDSSVLA